MKGHQLKLIAFYRAHRRMPTYTEMMTLFNYKTKSAVEYAVRKLVAGGVLSKDKHGKLIPKRLYGEVKLLGVVEAGFPSPAEEELVDAMSLDEFLIRNKEATFMLKVKGDSMVGAGIIEGDMVLVERGKSPQPGDIVIASVDGEYTMKYLRGRGDGVYLEAANAKYPPIYPENDLRIEAVVQAVIRRY
jgi:SOS regulatory protein LexA